MRNDHQILTVKFQRETILRYLCLESKTVINLGLKQKGCCTAAERKKEEEKKNNNKKKRRRRLRKRW